MRPGIDDRVRDVVVREVGVTELPSKANWRTRVPGTRNSSRSAQTSGVIKPKSSAMNGSPPNSFFTALKKSAPGPRTHWPDWAVGAPAGNMPRRCERAKMIQTNHIYVCEQSTQTIDAPTIASLPKCLPVVDRVAPKLTLSTEIIRGHASHEARLSLVVQQE